MSREIPTLSVALLLVCLLPAEAWAIDAGQRCALKKPFKVAAKAKGRGKKTKLKKGTEVEVVTVEGRWATLRAGDVEGSAAVKKLERICEPMAVAPPQETHGPGDAVDEAAPETPADGAGDTPVPGDSADAVTGEANDGADAAAPSDAEPPPDGGVEPIATPDADRAALVPLQAAVTPQEEDSAIKLAVMDLRGSESIAAELLASLTALIPQELEATGPFDAISSQDVRQMLSFEAQKQMVGCDEASCLAEIGGALGVDYIVSGSVTAVAEGHYLLQLQLMNIAEARVDGRVAREKKGDVAGLLEEVRVSTRLVVRDLLAQNAGTLLVRVNEEAAVISVDGSIIGNSPMGAVEIGGGTHEVVIEKEGFIRTTRDIDLRAGGEVVLDVQLRPSAEFLRQYQASAGRTRLIAWTGIAVGAAALAGAGGFFYMGQQTASDLDSKVTAYNASSTRSSAELNAINDLDSKLGTYDMLTLVLAGVGVTAAGVGTVLLLTGDDPDRYQAETAVAGPGSAVWLLPAPGGLTLGGRF